MKLSHLHIQRLAGAALCAALHPGAAFAAVCPTATFDQILTLGACTIGDASFDFTHPHLPGLPVYFAGPFAGNTGLGPAATALTFTPNTSADPTGFSLSGNFIAFGQAMRFSSFSQSTVVGNFFDESLAYFNVTPGGDRGLTGYSVALGNAGVSQSPSEGSAAASLNSATAIVTNAGFSQLSDGHAYDAPIFGTVQFSSDIHTYERSPDPAVSAGFGSITYRFDETAITAAVPEPETYALLIAGLAVVGWVSRRRRS